MRLLSFCLLLLFAAPVLAQDFTVFSADRAVVRSEDDASATRWHLAAAAPIGGATVGLQYRSLHLAGNHGGQTDRFHEVRLLLFGEVELKSGYSLSLYAGPGLASDFREKAGRADFDLRSAVVLRRSVDWGTYGLGVAYRNRLDLAVAPVFELKADLPGGWSVDVLGPARATLAKGLTQRAEMSLVARYSTYSYRQLDEIDSRIDHTLIVLGPELRMMLTGSLAVSAGGHYAIKNRLEFGEGASEYGVSVDERFVARLALVFVR